MELIDVVQKLSGPIDPVGETSQDNARFESLQTITELVEHLLVRIGRVAENQSRAEFSMKRAGQHASEFLARTIKWLEENGSGESRT